MLTFEAMIAIGIFIFIVAGVYTYVLLCDRVIKKAKKMNCDPFGDDK